jgi:hypothetical protein
MTIIYGYKTTYGLASGRAVSLSVLGKPVTGVVEIDSTPRNWFFDPTPLDHAEFEFSQRLYRDLSNDEQEQWYGGAAPELLEVSYRGDAVETAPPSAQDGLDMFSTIVHEIGHVLGLSHRDMIYAETVEEGDFDVDVNPRFVGGATMAIRTAGTDPDDVRDWSHLGSPSLMCDACSRPGLRRLPSATDVLAIASAAGWTQIDLARKDFLRGTNWDTASNWIGDRVPDLDDDVSIRTGGVVTLSRDAAMKNLSITEASGLATGPHQLSVTGSVRIHGEGPDRLPQLALESGGRLETNRLEVQEGVLALHGGLAEIGGYVQESTGTLAIELYPPATGNQAPRLTVDGITWLDGNLQVTAGPDYAQPTASIATVKLIESADAVVGSFSLPPARHLGNGLFVDVLYFENEVRIELLQGAPGDANGDRQFDQFDIVQVSAAAKYLTGQKANWTEGDWAITPQGGNGVFDQFDIIAALAGGYYLHGRYAANAPEDITDGLAAMGLARHVEPLVAADVPSISVPEPSTTRLLILGFLTLASALRADPMNRVTASRIHGALTKRPVVGRYLRDRRRFVRAS